MGWTAKDTAKATGDSVGQARQAEHDARNDAAAAGELAERNANKVSDSPHGSSLHETFKSAGMVGGKGKK